MICWAMASAIIFIHQAQWCHYRESIFWGVEMNIELGATNSTSAAVILSNDVCASLGFSMSNDNLFQTSKDNFVESLKISNLFTLVLISSAFLIKKKF